MFQLLGNTVSRQWPLLLVGWLLLLGALWATAPEWDDVARGGEFVFLPPDAPSRQAERLFNQAFPNDPLGSSIVLVLHRDTPGGLTERDRQFVLERLQPELQQIADAANALNAHVPPAEPGRPEAAEGPAAQDEADVEPGASPDAEVVTGDSAQPIVSQILTFQDETIGPLLTSEDDRATLVAMDLTTDLFEIENRPIIRQVEELIGRLESQGEVPSGLRIDLTGSATLGRDMIYARGASADAIESWTVWVIIILLLLIYRSPLLALIPLLAVFMTVQIALKILILAAQAGWIGVFEGAEVYTTVVVYGAGVDYSLFLISRNREELHAGANLPDGIANAIGKVGAAIAASAGTVIFGIGMMYFAEFGKFREAGITIAFSLFVMLWTSLTFVPAVLRLFGPAAYWPLLPGRQESGGRLGWLRRLARENRFEGTWNWIGQMLLRVPGTIWLATLAAMLPFAVVAVWNYNALTYGLVSELPRDMPSVQGTEALHEHFPGGITSPVTVLIRNERIDFRDPQGVDRIATMTEQLQQQMEPLQITDIRSVANPLGVTAAAERALPEARGFQRLVQRRIIRERAAEYYVSSAGPLAGDVTRLTLVLDSNPFSRESIIHLDEVEHAVRNALPAELQQNSQIHLLGSTASLRDLKEVAVRDRQRIQGLVTISVLFVLIVLLRRILLSLYLILSVLFSYLATLGVTFLVFRLLEGPDFAGLDWTVPIFLFTLLVAIGEDYNIFLVTRINEEQARHGPIHGVTHALLRTGGIISSCGLIMAGTFSSLMFGGTLAGMVQLGFALAFGVLLDTFVVRPILVPSYLLLVNSGRFGRFGEWLSAK